MQNWLRLLSIFAILECGFSYPQVVLETPAISNQPWDAHPSTNATGNLIFQSVSSLLQHWPNTKYVNGHTIASASIAPGTVLYHGRNGGEPAMKLDEPEWLATDPEHSYVFCRSACQLLSFVSTRKLRLAYFDGSSASKLGSESFGNFDSQDILIWGKVRPSKMWSERERISDACKWGKEYGLDGFVRMEMDFEVMMCDFVDGLKLVSNSTVVTSGRGDRHGPRRKPPKDMLSPPPPPPPDDTNGPSIPEGWKGATRTSPSVGFEVINAGFWHGRFPGETRVHIDYSRLVSFFDPALTSLVASRMNQTRRQYRIAGISLEDAKNARNQLVDIFTRDGEGSGIDWGSVAHVIVDRYSGRLELVRHLLEDSDTRNVTQQAAEVRAQVLTMLTPYMLAAAIPPNTTTVANKSWIAPVVDHCASTLTSWATLDILTRQEQVVKHAVEEVQHEICRVLGDVWLDAFDVEAATVEETRSLLDKWSKDINTLMDWLDWSVWDICKPACGPEEMCYIPTWPHTGRGKEEIDMTPRCVWRLDPDGLGGF